MNRRTRGVRINCIARPILPPGATIPVGRVIHEPPSTDRRDAGLSRPSVVNVSQLVTLCGR